MGEGFDGAHTCSKELFVLLAACCTIPALESPRIRTCGMNSAGSLELNKTAGLLLCRRFGMRVITYLGYIIGIDNIGRQSLFLKVDRLDVEQCMIDGTGDS